MNKIFNLFFKGKNVIDNSLFLVFDLETMSYMSQVTQRRTKKMEEEPKLKTSVELEQIKTRWFIYDFREE